jgi:hypothetical protein
MISQIIGVAILIFMTALSRYLWPDNRDSDRLFVAIRDTTIVWFFVGGVGLGTGLLIGAIKF